MKHTRLFLLVILPLAMTLFSCTEQLPVSESGEELMADQHYYPLLDGTTWEYRVDTASASGSMVKDVARRYSVIAFEHRRANEKDYSVQWNRIVTGTESTFDTTYVRRDDIGVYQTTPGLLMLGSVGGIPGLPDFDFPDEILSVPLAAGAPGTWDIIDFEFLDIPLFPIYFRAKGEDLGIESVQTDMGMFYECRHIRFSIDIRLPNMEDPSDIFNPTLIEEEADFWYTHPQGLVVADGSSAVFGLLGGSIPLSDESTRMRLEVVDMDIVQPVYP